MKCDGNRFLQQAQLVINNFAARTGFKQKATENLIQDQPTAVVCLSDHLSTVGLFLMVVTLTSDISDKREKQTSLL